MITHMTTPYTREVRVHTAGCASMNACSAPEGTRAGTGASGWGDASSGRAAAVGVLGREGCLLPPLLTGGACRMGTEGERSSLSVPTSAGTAVGERSAGALEASACCAPGTRGTAPPVLAAVTPPPAPPTVLDCAHAVRTQFPHAAASAAGEPGRGSSSTRAAPAWLPVVEAPATPAIAFVLSIGATAGEGAALPALSLSLLVDKLWLLRMLTPGVLTAPGLMLELVPLTSRPHVLGLVSVLLAVSAP
eukprot:scaffold96143_cov17-Tisochrysis_lutea.AAC.1